MANKQLKLPVFEITFNWRFAEEKNKTLEGYGQLKRRYKLNLKKSF